MTPGSRCYFSNWVGEYADKCIHPSLEDFLLMDMFDSKRILQLRRQFGAYSVCLEISNLPSLEQVESNVLLSRVAFRLLPIRTIFFPAPTRTRRYGRSRYQINGMGGLFPGLTISPHGHPSLVLGSTRLALCCSCRLQAAFQIRGNATKNVFENVSTIFYRSIFSHVAAVCCRTDVALGLLKIQSHTSSR